MVSTPQQGATEPSKRVRQVAQKVRDMIAGGGVNVASAFDILRTAASVGASWEIAEEVLVEIAKGADGVSGTADDLIPAQTLEVIRFLLNNGVVRDIVTWAATAATGARAPLWMLGLGRLGIGRLAACASPPKTAP